MEYIYEYNYEKDSEAFGTATIDFFYDQYFKGAEGHDYTDEQVSTSVQKDDIDNCLEVMKHILYKHFDVR